MNRCVACGAEYAAGRVYRSDLPGDHDPSARYRIVTCPACGTGVTEPAPSGEALRRLYADYGSRAAAPGSSPGKPDLLVRLRRAYGFGMARRFYRAGGLPSRWLRRLMSCFLVPRVTLAPLYTDLLRPRLADRPLRLLDVGCGSAEVLEFAAAAGVQATGTEFDEPAAAAARALGLDVRAVSVGELLRQEARFDIVRYSHVMEHVADPEGELCACHGLLGPGGYLLVAVPQLPSLVTALGRHAHYHVPFHLHHFTRRGLRALVTRCGFRVLTVRSKSNSVLSQSLARWMGRESWVNHPAFRLLCIGFEVVADAFGVGDAMELHALAVGPADGPRTVTSR